MSCMGESEEPQTEYSIDLLAGHTFIGKAKTIGYSTRTTELAEDNFEKNIKYLAKISKLCEKRGIALELCVFPACNSLSDKDNAELAAICADLAYPEYMNYQSALPHLGIDDATDYFDMLHFNSSGAWKFSRHFASSLDIGEAGAHDTELWQQRVEHFKALASESELNIR